MKKLDPRLPTGMRDSLPADMLRRQYAINQIASTFERFGYEPLQTPVMELSETLAGKYGEDAERLIYFAQHARSEEQLALRYDLTVPLVRAFAQHEGQLSLPFRRYQIAPVWRADRPQRGRFREFFQCDADVIGVATIDADAEVVNLMDSALVSLGFDDFAIKISNRKLLTGIGVYAGVEGEALANLYKAIDKLDKIGMDGVKKELIQGGIPAESVEKLITMFESVQQGDTLGIKVGLERLEALRQQLQGITEAEIGLGELKNLFAMLQSLGVADQHIEFDISMVRGLSYYTGPIFEAMLRSGDPEERVGSIGGGGRYDDLTGLFRKQGSLPVVGISLGIERLIVIMDNREMYPSSLNRTVVQVLVAVFNDTMRPAAMRFVSELRQNGIRAELYLGPVNKLGKQFAYADKKGIPLVALIAPDEDAQGLVKLKVLSSQQESTLARADAVQRIREFVR